MNAPTPLHPFDLSMGRRASAEDEDSRFPADYANVVGPFGGIIAARMLDAVLRHDQAAGIPVSMTVNFAAPVADAAVRIDAEFVRGGRITQHWNVTLRQADEVVITASVVLARRRPSWSDTEAQPPAAPPPEQFDRLPPKGFPPWVEHYDMRIVSGPIRAGSPPRANSTSVLWMRDEPPRPLDFPALAARCDAFFPRVFVRRQALAPIGTVSMTIYFHADSDALARVGDAHVLATARAQRFHDSFFDQSAELWSAEGELLASTHQIVFFKDPP